MTTLKLTADQVARQVDGSWLITMDGLLPYADPCPCDQNHAPPELVALLQPCSTCKGGTIYTLWPGEMVEDPVAPCSDCAGSGRLVFDLTVPCDGCNGFGYHVGSIMTPNDCYHCRRRGTVSYRVWLDPDPGVVLVTDDQESIGSAYEGPACVEMYDSERARLWPAWSGALEYDGGVPITLPPAAKVGDFVARAVEVDDE